MGCWNGTCMVSGMPITYGDPIVSLVITQDKTGHWGRECYCHAEAYLISPPIFGIYNDYGGIEDIEENEDTKHFFDWVSPLLTASPGHDFGVDTDNQCHHFKQPKTLEEAMNNCFERGFACVPGMIIDWREDEEGKKHHFYNPNGKVATSLAMIHRGIWDHMMERLKKSKNWHGELIVEKIQKQIDSIRVDPKPDEEMILRFMEPNDKHPEGMSREKATELAKMIADTRFMMGDDGPLRGIDTWKGDDVKNYSDEAIMNIRLLVEMLEMLRIHIHTVTGKGSQTQEWDEHLAVYAAATEIINNKLKEWEEE